MSPSFTEAGARLARAVGARTVARAQRPSPHRVLYNSFNGRYSDNPRAIHEELLRRFGPDRDHAWIIDGTDDHPPSSRMVAPYSWDYLREVARSGYVVSNLQMPNNFRKRRGMTYLQTWHGTPLKRIGFDNDRWLQNPAGLRATATDFARWDYLISPNAFSTEIFRRAFRFEGEVLETGYPRNDVLNSPDREELRAEVRSRLGIEEGVTAVLYAPTWRDNLVDESGNHQFSLALDLEQLSSRLGDSHVVLLRLHYLIAAKLADSIPGVRNVSAHPDIRDLYLAADVLVTDYSSTMFDFAVTGRPIVFFAYDLEAYRDDVRGFYFDLEQEAPGPVCRTSDEVIDSLEDLAGAVATYEDRYRRFKDRFCRLEDGRAAARVVDRVFGR